MLFAYAAITLQGYTLANDLKIIVLYQGDNILKTASM